MSHASSVRSATIPSMSPFSTVSTKLPTRSRSSFELGSGARSRPVAGRRDVERRPRAAQEAVDRRLSGLEHLGDLTGAVAEDVAQHQHRALLRRQMLEAGDEGQRDPLARLVARLRAGSLVGDSFEEEVGVRLEPERLVPAGRLGQLRHPLLLRASAVRPQGIERAIGGDPVQPSPKRGALLEPWKAPPGGEQRLLEHVLRLLDRADDPVDVQLQLAPVGIGQLAKRVLVPTARTGEHRLGHRRILAPTPPVAPITK